MPYAGVTLLGRTDLSLTQRIVTTPETTMLLSVTSLSVKQDVMYLLKSVELCAEGRAALFE